MVQLRTDVGEDGLNTAAMSPSRACPACIAAGARTMYGILVALM
jgi:hypothetical protein